jgi:hypothetical protein
VVRSCQENERTYQPYTHHRKGSEISNIPFADLRAAVQERSLENSLAQAYLRIAQL